MRLTAKYPIDSEIDPEVRDRFRGCEAKQLSRQDGEPLVLCAITDWIAVGFPIGSCMEQGPTHGQIRRTAA